MINKTPIFLQVPLLSFTQGSFTLASASLQRSNLFKTKNPGSAGV